MSRESDVPIEPESEQESGANAREAADAATASDVPVTEFPPGTPDVATAAAEPTATMASTIVVAADDTAPAVLPAEIPTAETAGIPAAAEATPAAPTTPAGPQASDRVRARVAAIEDEFTQLEIPGPTPGRIRSAELRDRDGAMLLRVNDRFTASIASVGDVITLTLGKKRGVLDAARLRLALEQRTAVTGTVQAMNKGGFEVRIGRVRAFCPLSQIDAGFVEVPESFMGKSLTFRVLRWENHGRNIVVSRRSVLRDESKAQAQELRKQLVEGAEFEGIVKRLQPFGAFVDLGGIEGLLHVSRMGYSRVDDPAAVVSVGGKVRVRVVKIEHPGTRRERIALALADLGPDPWAQVQEQLHVGDVLSGTVVRLAPFGAFVHLSMGLDGLVHLSELSSQRIAEPQEVVTPGQEVQVRVLHVDVEKRRISLSLRRATEAEEPPPRRREPRRERPPRQREKAPSPASGSVTLTHTMADQLGLLKQKLRGQA